MSTAGGNSGQQNDRTQVLAITHTLSWDEAYTLIYSLGEWLDRLQGLGDWQTGDENVELTDETKREIGIVAELRETIIARQFPHTKARSEV